MPASPKGDRLRARFLHMHSLSLEFHEQERQRQRNEFLKRFYNLDQKPECTRRRGRPLPVITKVAAE